MRFSLKSFLLQIAYKYRFIGCDIDIEYIKTYVNVDLRESKFSIGQDAIDGLKMQCYHQSYFDCA